ncbi:MAG: DUF1761 domain-containing protein [Rhodospirillaceae bacterium]|nr:DUF1761 domain-containing protein [Rhodospirillaceae bacterium]
MGEIIWLSLPLCIVISLAIGVVWYGPLFKKAWMEDTGMLDEKMGPPTKAYGGAALHALIGALALNLLLDRTNGLLANMSGGLIIGVAAAAAIGINYMFSSQPRRLLYIDGGYTILMYSTMGAAVGLLR